MIAAAVKVFETEPDELRLRRVRHVQLEVGHAIASA